MDRRSKEGLKSWRLIIRNLPFDVTFCTFVFVFFIQLFRLQKTICMNCLESMVRLGKLCFRNVRINDIRTHVLALLSCSLLGRGAPTLWRAISICLSWRIGSWLPILPLIKICTSRRRSKVCVVIIILLFEGVCFLDWLNSFRQIEIFFDIFKISFHWLKNNCFIFYQYIISVCPSWIKIFWMSLFFLGKFSRAHVKMHNNR